MKTMIVTLIFILTGMLSCEDDSVLWNESVYGKWKLFSVSGGFAGTGHDLNFDYLEIEKENNYRFIKDGDVLEFGTISLIKEDKEQPLINFVPDDESEVFMGDSEKYLVLEGKDTLNLNSPCCDRFNYHFVKE